MADRAARYSTTIRQPLVQLAMLVGRICAERRRPVTPGEIRELLACSESTACRYFSAFVATYPDVVAEQASGALSADAVAILGYAPARAGTADALEAALRSAALSDDFDNVDPEYPEGAQ